MFGRAIMVGVAVLVAAAPATAQQRGTMEFGAFASAASFDNKLSLTSGYGLGGRLGMFFSPRLSVEFEDAEMRGNRPSGLATVNVGILSGRLVLVPLKAGALSILLGGGAGVSTETNFLHSYGVDALLGAKLAFSDNAAIRLDGVWDWLANQDWQSYKSIRLGLSFYRHSNQEVREVMVDRMVDRPVVSAPIEHFRTDTVVQTRVDTVQQTVTVVAPVEQADQLVLRVQFETNLTSLLPKSRPVLDTIAMAIIATPNSHWDVQGHTDSIGSAQANKVLAQGRAQTVVDYLVSKGVSRSILMATGVGPDRPVFSNSTEYGRAQNRRVQLRRIPAPPTGPAIK